MTNKTTDRTTHSSRRFRRVCLPVLLLGTISLLVGCESSIGSFRATTFPPDLSYLPPQQVRSVMWTLAAELQILERSIPELRDADTSDNQMRAANSLERMILAARELDTGGRATQHPVLNQHRDRFLARLARAKRDVEAEPPLFGRASRIAGSCYLCHARSQLASLSPL